MSLTESRIRDQISLMEDREEKKWMESMYDGIKFSFIYDGIADINPNPGHDIVEFQQGRFVVVEFSALSINFKSKTNPKSTLNYNFRLQSIYLIEEDEQRSTSTPAKWQQDPDDWVISSLRTRKSTTKTKRAQSFICAEQEYDE